MPCDGKNPNCERRRELLAQLKCLVSSMDRKKPCEWDEPPAPPPVICPVSLSSCDPPCCYPIKRCKSFDFRASIMYRCECIKRNGLQDRCMMWDCMGRPECMTKLYPVCGPGRAALLKLTDLGDAEVALRKFHCADQAREAALAAYCRLKCRSGQSSQPSCESKPMPCCGNEQETPSDPCHIEKPPCEPPPCCSRIRRAASASPCCKPICVVRPSDPSCPSPATCCAPPPCPPRSSNSPVPPGSCCGRPCPPPCPPQCPPLCPPMCLPLCITPCPPPCPPRCPPPCETPCPPPCPPRRSPVCMPLCPPPCMPPCPPPCTPPCPSPCPTPCLPCIPYCLPSCPPPSMSPCVPRIVCYPSPCPTC